MEGIGGVAWQEWEPAAFARAKAEGKLVFLDISATWCHWCHVLDRTSLSDPRVVRLLNETYVPVRVDTDRRPDINDRYNQGGWPTTAVLLPDGKLLSGATYLPADALLELLGRCAEFYRRDRERIDRYMEEGAPPPRDGGGEEAPALEAPRPADLPVVTHAVLAHYDPVHPGFFRAPKFLMTEILAFLRDSWVLDANRETGDTFLAVLRTMASSPVFDAVEGGFFRYATKRDWTAPHYEKLLADNAEMLGLYASAYEKAKEPLFARTAEKILRFLFARLYDPDTGACFSSQDADEEYYTLGAEGRSMKSPPGIDRTLFSEYNGRAVSALVAAHRAFGGPKDLLPESGTLLARAERLGEFLHGTMWSAERGQIRFREGNAAGSGHLSDNVSAAEAHLDLWEATGNGVHLGRAREVVEWTVRRLFSPASFGFFDRGLREAEVPPLAVPLVPFSANARMACVLLRISRDDSRPDLHAVAELTLKGLAAEFDRRAAFAGPYGSALLLYLKGGRGTVCLPGDPSCKTMEG